VTDDYDDLFDAWGRALNVNPQLGKTVFHVESNGNPNAPNGTSGEVGPMQILPSTGAAMALKMGYDPRAMNLRDMRWAVPLGMQYLADGLSATGTAEGALGYYNTGSADPRRWRMDYIKRAVQLYPKMGLTPAPAQQPQNATPEQPQGNEQDAGRQQ